MDTAVDDSDIYDYDRSSFFRLLQSAKYRVKYEFIQQQQGLVVCPLKLKLNNRIIKQPESLIDCHLFVPSPFYKNHFVPLSSLIALGSLNSANIATTSLPLDHSQQISLVLRSSEELVILSGIRRICKSVKLLNVQTAYNDSAKSYKILIVDRELNFKINTPQQIYQNQISKRQSMPNIHTIHEIVSIDEKEDSDTEQQTQDTSLKEEVETSATNSDSFDTYIPAVSHRNSTFMQDVSFSSLDDVKKFGQSVDFMQSSAFMSHALDTDCETTLIGENDLDENSNRIKSNNKWRPSQQSKAKSMQQSFIGEDLLNEIELFRKTYIILYTHIYDCIKQLQRMYRKYVRRFLESAQNSLHLEANSSVLGNIDVMVSIACENTIVGYIFAKLWPCLLQLNAEEDGKIQKKCDRIRKLLRLNQIVNLTNETTELCSRFFHIDQKYFLINTQPVLREFKRLSLLNNPFEKLECIKTSLELVTNELTILSSQTISDKESIIITSEILIPLLGFILIRSNINCFKSICYFIDNFQFSAQENSFSSAHCSTRLDELAFFMTTFKAAIQFIETSY